MTAEVIQFPVPEPAVDPLEPRFVSEEARQAYYAGYSDGVRDASGEAPWLAAIDRDIRVERARRGWHLNAVTS